MKTYSTGTFFNTRYVKTDKYFGLFGCSNPKPHSPIDSYVSIHILYDDSVLVYFQLDSEDVMHTGIVEYEPFDDSYYVYPFNPLADCFDPVPLDTFYSFYWRDL